RPRHPRSHTPAISEQSHTRNTTPASENGLSANEIDALREALPRIIDLDDTLEGFAAAQQSRLDALGQSVLESLDQIKKQLKQPSAGRPRNTPTVADSDDEEEDSLSESDALPNGTPPPLSHLLEFFPW